MEDIIAVSILRSICGYFGLLLVVRLIGRKVISQMTFFEFAVGICIGSVTANVGVMTENTFISALVVLATIALLTMSTDFLNKKSLKIRKLVNSEPIVVIANGQIVNENMKKGRITLTLLMSLLREKSIFNISDVEYAILENGGALSVRKKSQKLPVTPEDLRIPTSYKGLTRDLIHDGKVLEENLSFIKLDQNWLDDELRKQGISDIKEVFYAGLDTLGNLYISKFKNDKEVEGQYGIE